MPGPSDDRIRAADALVGQRIRERRKLLDVSLETLSKAAGVAVEQLRELESGRLHARASVLVSLARALAVPLTYFVEKPEPLGQFARVASAARLPPLTATPAARESLKSIRARYKAAGPDERKRLQTLARLLAARGKGAKPE